MMRRSMIRGPMLVSFSVERMNIYRIGSSALRNGLSSGTQRRFYHSPKSLAPSIRRQTTGALNPLINHSQLCPYKPNHPSCLRRCHPLHRALHTGQPTKETTMSQRSSMQPQSVDAPLTQFATFIVLSVKDTPDALKTARSVIAGIEDLSKNVIIRDPHSLFSCTVGIGSDIWDKLTGLPRPAELHPFKEVKGKTHTAVSTPGDILLHIRAERRDLCFEFERQLMDSLGDSVSLVDETEGFRYFDLRDLLGFVDGTANPVGPAVPEAVLVNQDDGYGAGGSYIVVQKYLHDIPAWKALSTDAQEGVIGRTKADNIELDDAESGKQQSHKSLTTIEDADGGEHEILRDNMPFGSPASGEFGTYFIGYTAELWVIERMMERMFVGDPPGLHDRILDFSKPLTGTTFFAPPANVLAGLEDG